MYFGHRISFSFLDSLNQFSELTITNFQTTTGGMTTMVMARGIYRDQDTNDGDVVADGGS